LIDIIIFAFIINDVFWKCTILKALNDVQLVGALKRFPPDPEEYFLNLLLRKFYSIVEVNFDLCDPISDDVVTLVHAE
jgi:hypothetical protein